LARSIRSRSFGLFIAFQRSLRRRGNSLIVALVHAEHHCFYIPRTTEKANDPRFAVRNAKINAIPAQDMEAKGGTNPFTRDAMVPKFGELDQFRVDTFEKPPRHCGAGLLGQICDRFTNIGAGGIGNIEALG